MKFPRKIALACLATIGFTCLLIWQWPKISQSRILEIKNSGSGTKTSLFSSVSISENESDAENANFLLLGAAGEGNDAPDLTDTILVASLNTDSKKIFLFSLPRDLLVKISDSENFTKLNALYAINKNDKKKEFNSLITKTEQITGLKIDHYIFVDLATIKNTIDILNGVNLMVKKDIRDEQFPGPNHSFQTFEIKAGWRYLDGETALKYIRSRHSANGDFDRIGRQQEIIQALKQKVLSLNFWNIATFSDIYKTLSKNIKTDLNLWEIGSLWKNIQKIPGENIIKNELSSANLFVSAQVELGGQIASVIQPKAGMENYEGIKKYIKQTINP